MKGDALAVAADPGPVRAAGGRPARRRRVPSAGRVVAAGVVLAATILACEIAAAGRRRLGIADRGADRRARFYDRLADWLLDDGWREGR